MAASLKDAFISLMTGFLKKANMVDSAMAYYSFTPISGQSNYKFVYNDLAPTGTIFVQKVASVTITNQGSGYNAGENPTIAFVASDGGTGAAATGIISSTTTVSGGLVRAFPLDATGTNLAPYGDFSSGNTGWLDANGNAALTGVAHIWKFESGGLHFASDASTPSTIFSYRFVPSGFTPLTGAGWLMGSFDMTVFTPFSGSPGPQFVISATGISNPQGFYLTANPSTGSGTIYWGAYLSGGTTITPFIQFFKLASFGTGTTPAFNFLIDNFKVWTGRFDQEKIFNNKLITNSINGPVNEGITCSADLYGVVPVIANGKNGMSLLSNNEFHGAIAQRGSINIALADTWNYFSYGFWHYFSPNTGFAASDLTIADFTNGSFSIVNNTYALKVTPANAVISTNIQPTSGWHYVVVGFSPATSNTYQAFISVDTNYFSSTVNGFLPSQTNPTWHFYATDTANSYSLGVDEISIWNRALTSVEISEIYNNGTGAFYPFTGVAAGNYGHLSGVVVTAGGTNYTVTPSVSIAAPTGGGTAAQAIAVLTPDSGKIYASSLPAFSVGGTNNIINTLTTGTGTFAYGTDDFLRIGNNINFDWTIFLAFNQTGSITGKHSVLLSTKDSYFDSSGFILGINDANRVFFEHWDTSNTGLITRRSYTHNYELGNFNLLSVSKDSVNGTITLCNHDIAGDVTYGLTYYLQGYTDNNKIYLGGFPNSGTQSNYTGFIGRMMDILLLSGVATPSQADAIAPLFFVTGYTPEETVPVYNYFPITTGVQLTIIVNGTGVTGYAMNQVTISGADGSIITGWDIFPQTGLTSGTGIAFYTGGVSGVSTSYSGQQEQFFFYGPYIKNYSRSSLVFLNYGVTTGDILQVYSFDDKWFDQVNLLPTSFNLYDYYLDISIDSSTGVNVYSDGLLQYTGTDYVVTSGLLISTSLGQFQSNYNFLLYDIIPGVAVASGFSGYSGAVTLNISSNYINSGDVYLNGQKLISGIDYTQDSSHIFLVGTVFGNPVAWASGTFVFPPTRTGNRHIFTGVNVGFYQDFSGIFGNLLDEMVWLNGQRLAPEIDYVTVGSNSLLNTDNRASGCSFAIYTGDGYFDVSILKTKPNIS